EFHRILEPGGWVALLNYERDESDPFTQEYGNALRLAADTEVMESTRQKACLALLASALFDQRDQTEYPHAHDLDRDGLTRRMFSTSYSPQEGPVAAAITQRTQEAFARYQHGERVVLHYFTAVYLARRRELP